MGNHNHHDDKGASARFSEAQNQSRSINRADRIKTRLVSLLKTFQSRRKAKKELRYLSDHIRKDVGLEIKEPMTSRQSWLN